MSSQQMVTYSLEIAGVTYTIRTNEMAEVINQAHSLVTKQLAATAQTPMGSHNRLSLLALHLAVECVKMQNKAHQEKEEQRDLIEAIECILTTIPMPT